MKMCTVALLLLSLEVLGLAPCEGAKTRVTPTQQVINMMTDMKAKGEKMMEEEQKTYAAYAEWADDRSKELAFEVKDGQSKIEELIAFISKADSDVEKLGREISGLDGEIDRLEGEKKEATENRDEQHAEYLTLSKDYSESVDALKRAIKELSAQDFDRAQAESLLQRMSTRIPGMPRVLAAFVQEKSRTGSALRGDGAPEVAAYEFQSGGIVELLEGLLNKFSKELADVEEDESNQAHEYSLVEMHLSDTIKKSTSDRDDKAVSKGKKAAGSAKARGELAETRKEKAADEKLKSDIESTFAAKTSTYKQNQQVRTDELEAIGKAIEIMASPEASGSYAKHINLAQLSSDGAMSLLQLGRSQQRESARKEAIALLSQRAGALNSDVLASVAAQMAPKTFGKVIDMIETLLQRLKEEAAAEAEHKAWCDEQLKANKLKRNKKSAKVNQLSAEIDELAANIAEMGATIDKLVEEQAQLTKAMQEATEQREKEHAENTATIADAAAGIDAVRQAITVLKEFYSSQSSLLQQVPEMAEYKGMQSSKGGVIGMLEVIETDFTRLKAETEASEKAAASEYDNFMSDSKASKLRKHEAEVQLKLDKDQAEFEKGETEKDRRATSKELATANKYFEYLKPNCLEVKVSWEERVARRKEEIAALKEAYSVLDRKGSA